MSHAICLSVGVKIYSKQSGLHYSPISTRLAMIAEGAWNSRCMEFQENSWSGEKVQRRRHCVL